MKTPSLKELASLSPFELKNFLTETASRNGAQLLLNAGRGNPNFLATEPRHGFMQWGLFAMSEAERSFSFMPEGVGGLPEREGIEARFEIFLTHNQGTRGIAFIRGAVSYVKDQLGLSAGDFIHEMTQAILGCMYPVPDRMLRLSESVVREYLRQEMVGSHPFAGSFDIFAVEGGTAAITYLFETLRSNSVIREGDSIALGMPIFTPYIEIPVLRDYQLVEVNVEADATSGWQYSREELDKLRDPAVKAFFLVNPSNPPSVKMDDASLAYLAEIVRERPELIILTDDVYGTFADDFTSLFAVCPQNTILVYSFSKYFGATGWRLGVIATHEDNVIDRTIATLPPETRKAQEMRYASITTDPARLKFIDRLVADSRTVALNHTAGLATPAQAQMVLFSLYALMDGENRYKQAMKHLIRRRKEALYKHLPVKASHNVNDVDYYHLFDLEVQGVETFGQEFVDWLLKTLAPNQFLFSLAEKTGIVLLPGKGFGATHPSARVSLANLNEVQYAAISKGLWELLQEYYAQYCRSTGKPAPVSSGFDGQSGKERSSQAAKVTPTQAALASAMEKSAADSETEREKSEPGKREAGRANKDSAATGEKGRQSSGQAKSKPAAKNGKDIAGSSTRIARAGTTSAQNPEGLPGPKQDATPGGEAERPGAKSGNKKAKGPGIAARKRSRRQE